jgi:diguanylate cyclase (GGDEF)-like protein
MRGRYAISLGILAAYFIASYFVLHAAIVQQRSMAKAMSVGGQQRMYSQRIAMFADAVVTEKDAAAREKAREDLATSIRIFRSAHEALVTGDPSINPAGWPPPGVRALYFGEPNAVDKQVMAYIRHAEEFEARSAHAISPDDPDLTYLLTVGPGPLLQSLDEVVHAYDAAQHTAIQRFELLQIVLLVLGLSTLVAVWFTILMPLEREIAKKTAQLERAASLDPLTDILNRSAFSTRVEELLAHARRSNERGAMLLIDLDRFKAINDTLGHSAGDRALIETARRLRTQARAGEYITRLGGDEFAVYAPSTTDLEAFVTRMADMLQFEMSIDGTPVRVGASIGVARFPDDATTLDDLLVAADKALYAAKHAGRGTYRFSSP